MSTLNILENITLLRNNFNSGATRNIAWRLKQLQQLKKMTSENQAPIRDALKKDLNKCELEAYTGEIGYVLGEIDYSVKKLRKWMQPRSVATPMMAQPGKSYIQPEPLGTVLIIGAWNYPYQLVIAPLIAAIAAGNCAVIKPSELSPNTSAIIAELIGKYLDKEAFLVVEGGVEETTAVLQQQFDHILYTGGEVVGKIVMRAAAEYLTPVTLELGGKSPCVVENSADLKVSAARIAWCKWMNAGQTCVAPDYVIIQEDMAEKFISVLRQTITAFYGDDPATSDDYARIVNQRHFQRIMSYLEGENVTLGGEHKEQERYIAPTIVLNPSLDSKLMQEEIFGPILPVITVKNIEQAIPFINARPKPLAMYVFTKRSNFEQKMLQETSAGSVCVNDGMMFMANKELPFGGVGMSGMGSYSGQAGFDTFSHLKAVMKRQFMFDVDIRYPPYSQSKLNWLKRLS